MNTSSTGKQRIVSQRVFVLLILSVSFFSLVFLSLCEFIHTINRSPSAWCNSGQNAAVVDVISDVIHQGGERTESGLMLLSRLSACRIYGLRFELHDWRGTALK